MSLNISIIGVDVLNYYREYSPPEDYSTPIYRGTVKIRIYGELKGSLFDVELKIPFDRCDNLERAATDAITRAGEFGDQLARQARFILGTSESALNGDAQERRNMATRPFSPARSRETEEPEAEKTLNAQKVRYRTG